jgi:hypothetical protein
MRSDKSFRQKSFGHTDGSWHPMHLLFALCSGDNYEICIHRLPGHSRTALEWSIVLSSWYRARRNDGQVPQRSGARVLRNIQVFGQRELR